MTTWSFAFSNEMGGIVDIDRTKFRKEVLTPFTGQTFTIRRVRFSEFMSEIGGLALPTATAVQDMLTDLQEKAKSGDTKAEENVLKFYVTKGTVAPKVWFGDDAECPPDQIYYLDLGSDLDVLATEIINYSNGRAVQAMENFFFQQQTGTGDPRLDGAPIQPEAIEPTT